MNPPGDRYHELLRDVAAAHAAKGLEAGRAAFGSAAGEIWPGLPVGAMARPTLGRRPGWQTKHPKLQLLTVAEILAGKGIDYPHQTASTFKKAPKHEAEQPKSDPLF